MVILVDCRVLLGFAEERKAGLGEWCQKSDGSEAIRSVPQHSTQSSPLNSSQKLTDLGLNTHLCNCLPDKETTGGKSRKQLLFNTDTEHKGSTGSCAQPSLYSLFIHDFVAKQTSNIILGLITEGDKSAYRDEVSALSKWCYENNLYLSKTNEMIMDCRKLQKDGHSPKYINGAKVERVSSVHLTDDLTLSLHSNTAVRSAHQYLFFL
ncbi:hypothetical protein P4O66_009338 [Electrophorus voltai]|uniref:Reverse transcriptase domain-containing protein n=1 Tax=Electrophorus voltai TaxID=2609070 RepID=A0AAD8ZBH8_9TELE|nr:hypothetical protein P4O66_009338 [Electrophorus voltai]